MFLPSPPIARLSAALALLCALASCSKEQVGPVEVSVIGTEKELADPFSSVMTPASKLILEATAQGLVAFDEAGQIVPALAQRWIVEDDGRSYIFRLRRARWPDGVRIDAKAVARLLEARIKAVRGLDPLGDLEAVQEVVPMTGEVIEIRLSSARPYFLQMLAQPQMGIMRRDGGTGPYRKHARPHSLFLRPVADPLAARDGDDAQEVPEWRNRVLRAEKASKAIARFRLGAAQLVLGGRFTDLPVLAKAEIDKTAIHIDPVQGLFGLAVTGSGAFFESQPVREALSMAIERERLPAAFALGGWGVTDAIVPQQLDLPTAPTRPRWTTTGMEERRANAAAAIRVWRTANGAAPIVRVALPKGAGARILFSLLASDLRAIGVSAAQVAPEEDADLRLIDEVAAYDSAAWYLGRLSCARRIQCSGVADARLQEASLAATDEERLAKLGEAEALMTANAGYIPLAAPVRWSLAARFLTGFTASPRARHPLNHLFKATN